MVEIQLRLPEALVEIIRRSLQGETFVPLAQAFEVTASRAHGQILRCLQCGLVFMRPRLTEEQLLQEYARVEDPEFLERLHARERMGGRHVERQHSPFEQRQHLVG